MNLRKAAKKTCCWKLANTKSGRYLKFFIMIFLDLINLGIDWFFYGKIALAEPGLVYGPVDPLIKWTILAFCNISILSFIIETTQNADDLFEKKKIPFLTQSLSNFLVIFFEDIPLLVLNLIVTLCRDGEPTTISLVKASVGIAVVALRFLLMVFVYWLFDSKKSRFTFFIDILSTFGLFVIALLSISIQLLNTFPTDARGVIQLTNFKQFDRMEYATQKYLNDVGIFVKWPLDEQSKDQNQSDFKYFWLTDITEVTKSPYLTFKLRTDFDANNIQNYTFCTKKIAKNPSNTETCFMIRNSTNITEINSPNFISLRYEYNLHISKEPAQHYKYLIGFIDYNINSHDLSLKNSTESCKELPKISSMIYAKYTGFSSDKPNTIMKINDGKLSYYNFFDDLLSVDKFWKTGIVGCKMSGDLGPKINKKLRLEC